MAGAGAAWYTPLAWPLAHVARAASITGKETASKPTAISTMSLTDHLTSMCAASRSFALALVCIYVLTDDYPAFGRAATLEWSWMWPIVLRNLVATWMIAGTWDYFLYFSPLADRLGPFKLNKKRPSIAQFKHDSFWTTLSSVWAAGIEIALCYGWATGAIPMETSIYTSPVFTALAAAFITHWRIPHFYCIHRGMHPWKTTRIPDIGKFLYRHVHSLHHKSYNPTAFSGTSMHPVESTLYYSACLLIIPFGGHPALALGCIIDCGVGAWLGHDGFQWPGSGDYFHQLHHAHFDCNYGATHVPIDKWLGTFAGEKGDLRKIWGKKKSGADANNTSVHQSAAEESQAKKD